MLLNKKRAIALTIIVLMIMSLFFGIDMNLAKGATLSTGDFVYFWSNEEGILDKPVSNGSTETYKEADRHWQGLPSIARTANGRLWCAFQTGDVIEGTDGVDNYDVMYYSDDNGKTWSANYLIFDCSDETIRLTDPRLFIDNFGTFWLILIRGGGKGTYGIEIENPDCENPSKNLLLKKPIWWLKYPPAHRPTILKNGKWVTPVEANVKNQSTYLCNPDKQNNSYIFREFTASDGKATSAFTSKNFGESQIIELNDGRLMMLSRLPKNCGNGMEISYSTDFGAHWTAYESGFEEPYITPSSKFHIQRLQSGNILLLTNNSLTNRTNLTAYLSTDDGKTYPYKLLLDDRIINGTWGVSYPEAANEQGENGEIYIVYDAGRYLQKEIRLAIITEADIKAGEIVTESSFLREVVNKSADFKDIIDVQETIDRYQYFDIGVKKTDIISSLPTTLNITDEKNISTEITGSWESSNFNGNEKGHYSFKFVSSEFSDDIQDGKGLLNVYVNVGYDDPNTIIDKKPEETSGCKSLLGNLGGLSVSSVLALALIIKKGKRK